MEPHTNLVLVEETKSQFWPDRNIVDNIIVRQEHLFWWRKLQFLETEQVYYSTHSYHETETEYIIIIIIILFTKVPARSHTSALYMISLSKRNSQTDWSYAINAGWMIKELVIVNTILLTCLFVCLFVCLLDWCLTASPWNWGILLQHIVIARNWDDSYYSVHYST